MGEREADRDIERCMSENKRTNALMREKWMERDTEKTRYTEVEKIARCDSQEECVIHIMGEKKVIV